MKHRILLFFLSTISLFSFGHFSNDKDFIETYNLQNLTHTDESIQYELNQIITIVEKSITDHKKVIIPKGGTEYERLLFTARRIQHNDSQLVAIKLFKFILEFELYRTKGEELYIKLLMSTSLEYIGARVLARNYLVDIFPEFLVYLEDIKHKRFFLNHYAGLLMRNKDYKRANQTYREILKLDEGSSDSLVMFNARNNYGHTLQLLGNFDSAAFYFKENQKEIYKKLSPIIYAFSFGNYAEVLFKKKQLDSVIYYSQKELTLLREIPTTEGMGNTFKMIAESYNLMNQKDSSNLYYQKALKLYKINDDIRGAKDVLEKLIHSSVSSRSDEAFKKLIDEYKAYTDSLIQFQSNNTYEGNMNVFSYLQILDETHLSKKQFDVLEMNSRELIYLVGSLAILLLLLFVIIIIRRVSRKRLEKANSDLTEKNKALLNSYNTISETNTKNEILLKELHHRVKNNLQMIISLFNLQKNSGQLDDNAVEILQVAQDRIFSIALVHKKIYQSEELIKLNFREYLEAFIEEILGTNENKVEVDIAIEDFDLSIDSAVPLGLIINELFTNSLKHAKPEESKLRITIQQKKNFENCEFIYIDNGQGINVAEDIDAEKNSIGITLIQLFSEQLGAKIEFKEKQVERHGFWFSINGEFK